MLGAVKSSRTGVMDPWDISETSTLNPQPTSHLPQRCQRWRNPGNCGRGSGGSKGWWWKQWRGRGHDQTDLLQRTGQRGERGSSGHVWTMGTGWQYPYLLSLLLLGQSWSNFEPLLWTPFERVCLRRIGAVEGYKRRLCKDPRVDRSCQRVCTTFECGHNLPLYTERARKGGLQLDLSGMAWAHGGNGSVSRMALMTIWS